MSQFVHVVVQGSVLTNRKSSSTPSLSDVSESKSSVASTEQAASAENLTSTIKVVSCGYDTTLHSCTISFLSDYMPSYSSDSTSNSHK